MQMTDKIFPLEFSILLLYLGAVCYVIASYYHLKMNENWNFLYAVSIAIPLVVIEYTFTLHGNYFLFKHHDFSPVDILAITMVFYFVNLWLLNVFILQKKVKNILQELVAFLLIIGAFYLSAVI